MAIIIPSYTFDMLTRINASRSQVVPKYTIPIKHTCQQ